MVPIILALQPRQLALIDDNATRAPYMAARIAYIRQALAISCTPPKTPNDDEIPYYPQTIFTRAGAMPAYMYDSYRTMMRPQHTIR